MKITAEMKNTRIVNGLTVGDVEIWADGCNTPEEKAMAQLIATNIGSVVTMVKNLSMALFQPPKVNNENADGKKDGETLPQGQL